MRDFIYLDTDCLNSYLAQIDNGLPTKVQSGESNATQTLQESIPPQQHFKVAGKLGIALAGLESEIASDDEVSRTAFRETESGKKIIEKAMQDNIFELFLKHSNEQNLIKEPKLANAGDYILIKSGVKILDIKYIKNFFTKESVEDIVTVSSIQDETKSQSYKSNRQNREFSVLNGEINKNKAALRNSLKSIGPLLDLTEKFLPTPCTVFAENCIIPIKPEFMRESVQELSFKYGGRLTAFGRITKIGFKDSTPIESSNSFDAIQSIFDIAEPLLKGLGIAIEDNTKIVSPIALYFE